MGALTDRDLNALWVSIGVVLMVGGSNPGHTRVLSTTIFEHVEAMEYAQAQAISAFMLTFSFLVLLTVYIVNRRFPIHVS